MWSILGIVAFALFTAGISLSSLLRQKKTKDMLVFLGILTFATGLSIIESLRIDIPNPLATISLIYKPLSDWVLGFFQL